MTRLIAIVACAAPLALAATQDASLRGAKVCFCAVSYFVSPFFFLYFLCSRVNNERVPILLLLLPRDGNSLRAATGRIVSRDPVERRMLVATHVHTRTSGVSRSSLPDMCRAWLKTYKTSYERIYYAEDPNGQTNEIRTRIRTITKSPTWYDMYVRTHMMRVT